MESDRSALDDECVRFCRYLTGRAADPYVSEWYARARTARPAMFEPRAPFDGTLLAAARLRWLPLRCVDMVARFLAPGSAVRRRLVLVAAILENAPATYETFESPDTDSPAGFILRMLPRGCASVGALGLGALVIGSLHLGRRALGV